MKYLITGGLGFIGSEIVRQLLKKEDTEFIFIVDNNSKHATKNEVSFDSEDPRVKIFNCDLTNENVDIFDMFYYRYLQTLPVEKRLQHTSWQLIYPDAIIHLAAKIGGIAYFHKYPYTILDENNRMLSTMLDAINREEHCSTSAFNGRFVYISSSMVFENAREYPTSEKYLDDCPIPLSAYGFSKLSGEFYCKAFCDEHKLDYIICRPFNAYGTNEYPEEVGMAHVIPDIIKKIEIGQGTKDNPLEILGDGEQIRCYTHVEDVASGIITATLHGVKGQSYNISTPTATTVTELVQKIWTLMKPGQELFTKSVEPFVYDVQKRIPDVTKAKQQLNWQAKYDLDAKLPETIKWVQDVIRKNN